MKIQPISHQASKTPRIANGHPFLCVFVSLCEIFCLGSLAGSTVTDPVLDHGMIGPEHFGPGAGALNHALDFLNQRPGGGSLMLSAGQVYPLARDAEVDADVAIRGWGGVIAGPGTITGHGSLLDADPRQLFGSNVLVRGTWTTDRGFVLDWFGEDAAAFQRAANSLPAHGTLRLLDKEYLFDTPVVVTNPINIIMEGRGGIRYKGPPGSIALTITRGSRNTYRLCVWNYELDWRPGGTAIVFGGDPAHKVVACDIRVDDISGFDTGLWFRDQGPGISDNRVTLGYFWNNRTSIKLSTTGSGWIINNRFYQGSLAVGTMLCATGAPRIGIEMDSAGRAGIVNNVFWGPRIEVDQAPEPANPAVGLYFHGPENCTANRVIEGYYESANRETAVTSWVMRASGGAHDCYYGGYVALGCNKTDLLDEALALCPGTCQVDPVNEAAAVNSGPVRDVWPDDNLDGRALVFRPAPTSPVHVALPGFVFLPTTGAGRFAPAVADPQLLCDGRLAIDATAVGRLVDVGMVTTVFLNYDRAKQETHPAAYVIRCFDADGNTLAGGNPPRVTTTSSGFDDALAVEPVSYYGGAYRVSADYGRVRLHFDPGVRYAFLGLAARSANARVRARAFSVQSPANQPRPPSFVALNIINSTNGAKMSLGLDEDRAANGVLPANTVPCGGRVTAGDVIRAEAGAWACVARVSTSCTNRVPAGTTRLQVAEAAGATEGDAVAVVLDDGTWFWSRLHVPPQDGAFVLSHSIPPDRHVPRFSKVVRYRFQPAGKTENYESRE